VRSSGSALPDDSATQREPSRNAAAERSRRVVPAPWGPPPAVGEEGEVPRTVNEERPRPPAPHPRSDHPRPSDDRIVDIHVRFAVSVGRRVGVGVPVRHPDPAVLLRVDPLPGRRPRSLRLSLGRRGRRPARRRRGRSLGRRRGWRGRLGLRLRRRLVCLRDQRSGFHPGRVVPRPRTRHSVVARPGQYGSGRQHHGQAQPRHEARHRITFHLQEHIHGWLVTVWLGLDWGRQGPSCPTALKTGELHSAGPRVPRTGTVPAGA